MILQRLSIYALLAGFVAIWSDSGLAQGALAVGLPGGDPGNGFVYGLTVNDPQAQSTALSDCRGVDIKNTSRAHAACRIVATFSDQCVVVSFNGDHNTPSTAVGWAVAPNSAAAMRQSLARCEAMRGGHGRVCVDREPLCDGNAN